MAFEGVLRKRRDGAKLDSYNLGWMNCFNVLLCVFIFAATRFMAQGAAALPRASVHIVLAPADALVPDVMMDPKGILHMVYGLNHNAWYQRSIDNGKSFSPAVKINSAGTVETEMGERGPKLALGSNSVHVVWADDWAPGVKTFVRYSRSLDRGGSFEPLKTVSEMSGIDGVTITADEQDNVAALWHVMADPKPKVKAATWLYAVRSRDGGAHFEPNERVAVKNLSSLACSMCMMRARSGPSGSGRFYVAFRSAQDSIRDFYVLHGRFDQPGFIAQRVNYDNWQIDFCPMCGPELTFGPGGQAFCAFMSRHKIYWAVGDLSSTNDFRLHVATPASEENEIYPTAVANKKGEVLLLWQVGPMAVKGSATVKWAIYNRAGQWTGQSGVVGSSFAGTKATAFVGTNDEFYIVTTAR